MLAKIILKPVTEPAIGMTVVIPADPEKGDTAWVCERYKDDEKIKVDVREDDMSQMYAVDGDKEYPMGYFADVRYVLENDAVGTHVYGDVYKDLKTNAEYFTVNHMLEMPMVTAVEYDADEHIMGCDEGEAYECPTCKTLYDSLKEFVENMGIPLYDFERTMMIDRGKAALDIYEKEYK